MWRVVMCMLMCLCSLPSTAQRFVTLDWTVAETLMALGHPPVGMAQIANYHSWVGGEKIPEQTADIGLRGQPSMELLHALNVDKILLTPMFALQYEQFNSVADIEVLAMYGPEGHTWESILTLTRRLGALTNKEDRAEQLIDETLTTLDLVRSHIQDCGPLLITQLIDDRHVRVYAQGSVYQHVLDRLGIANAWTGGVNAWGYSVVGLHELASVYGRVVIIEPLPMGSMQRLEQDAFWHRLPVNREFSAVVVPPVWSLGGLVSVQRLADYLEQKVCRV